MSNKINNEKNKKIIDYLSQNSDLVKKRLLEKVSIDNFTGCWNWTGSIHRIGYGVMRYGPRDLGNRSAHIISYQLFVGEPPSGKDLDHLCRNRKCVNPHHLEPVSHMENMNRGGNSIKTHCKRGHEYNDSNTIFLKPLKNGWARRRDCIECRRMKKRGEI